MPSYLFPDWCHASIIGKGYCTQTTSTLSPHRALRPPPLSLLIVPSDHLHSLSSSCPQTTSTLSPHRSLRPPPLSLLIVPSDHLHSLSSPCPQTTSTLSPHRALRPPPLSLLIVPSWLQYMYIICSHHSHVGADQPPGDMFNCMGCHMMASHDVT